MWHKITKRLPYGSVHSVLHGVYVNLGRPHVLKLALEAEARSDCYVTGNVLTVICGKILATEGYLIPSTGYVQVVPTRHARRK